ncbi:hypothetical protein [Ottowia sp. VDI28]|uniref:hypothetical protein n=1 Tax=Ottowia sp. VDI28 TaxID=3133968 RepID=UPI003C2F0A64
MAILQWFVVPALAALARNVKSTERAITAVELSAWASDAETDFPTGIAELALGTLLGRGYVRTGTHRRARNKNTTNPWYVTPQGLHAAQAALRAMPKAPAPDMHLLETRLWNLLRIRKRLTSIEAAQTLIDAGENFDTQVKRIGTLLAAWAKYAPKAVAVAAKRELGRIRYVLVADLGRWPPPSRKGQVHPSEFASAHSVPAKFRREGAEQ